MKSTVKSNIFIDSNFWIYAFLDSKKDHAKQQREVVANYGAQSLSLYASIQPPPSTASPS